MIPCDPTRRAPAPCNAPCMPCYAEQVPFFKNKILSKKQKTKNFRKNKKQKQTKRAKEKNKCTFLPKAKSIHLFFCFVWLVGWLFFVFFGFGFLSFSVLLLIFFSRRSLLAVLLAVLLRWSFFSFKLVGRLVGCGSLTFQKQKYLI